MTVGEFAAAKATCSVRTSSLVLRSCTFCVAAKKTGVGSVDAKLPLQLQNLSSVFRAAAKGRCASKYTLATASTDFQLRRAVRSDSHSCKFSHCDSNRRIMVVGYVFYLFFLISCPLCFCLLLIWFIVDFMSS